MSYQFHKASVLVVDDMKQIQSLTASLLRIFGFKDIYTASDGDMAFESFRKHNPDIIITDWLMEPVNGIELAQRIRNDERSPNKFVPIVMMTGYSHKIRVEQARDIGITEFLVKPFTAKDLYARVERLIEKPRKFVDSERFFGPDRRRRSSDGYDGPFRREDEVSEQEDDLEIALADRGDVDKILKGLREQTKTRLD